MLARVCLQEDCQTMFPGYRNANNTSVIGIATGNPDMRV